MKTKYSFLPLRIISLLVVICTLFLCVQIASSAEMGHVVIFYDLPDNHEAEENVEAAADFSFYQERIESWLKKQGIPYSYHATDNFSVKLHSGKTLTFTKDILKIDVGFILIKSDKEYKILRGVHTGIDFIDIAKKYYDIK